MKYLICFLFGLAVTLLFGVMKARSCPLPARRFDPEPDVFDPSNNPFHWEKCPACGSCKITPVMMTRGIIVTHNCIGVPRHSQCQLDGHFATVIEACGAWNRCTEKWIEDRDLTRSK